VVDDVVNGGDSSTSSDSTVVLALDGMFRVLLELNNEINSAFPCDVGDGGVLSLQFLAVLITSR